jgi:aminoglycoside phosphotransferase (APT) family kinase protein
MTHLEGTDQIPTSMDVGRLRAAGAAAAAIHRVSLIPTPELPVRHRHMPWINLSEERLRGEAPTTALLERGDRLLSETVMPEHETVLVHGDLWVGNMLWRSGSYVGTIDWEAAGAGSYGVDLGSLRLDAALVHGTDAPDELLTGWEEASGQPARHIAYWDLVAALNTGADMTGFLPTMHQAGRQDLYGEQLTIRRDAFLAAALDRLE